MVPQECLLQHHRHLQNIPQVRCPQYNIYNIYNIYNFYNIYNAYNIYNIYNISHAQVRRGEDEGLRGHPPALVRQAVVDCALRQRPQVSRDTLHMTRDT